MQEVSQYLESSPFDTIIYDLRTKNPEMKDGKYPMYDIYRTLDIFIYLNYLIDENDLKDKDMEINFDRAIKVICESHFIMDPVD